MQNKDCFFSLYDDCGELFEIQKHLPLIIYFYPKDNTPGCTNENIEFSNLEKSFKKLGYEVVGISRDTIESHRKFKEKTGITVKLLADTTEEVCRKFNVMKLKNMYGKKVFGIERSTFIIDRNGKIAREYRKIKPVIGHAQKVLDDLTTKVQNS